jgi:phenylacetate-CoA ligase
MLERLRSTVGGIEWPAVPNSAGNAMLAVLFQLERSQWSSAAEIWAHQRRQLHELLRHAVASVPYYRKKLARPVAGLAAQFSPQDFSLLPALSRAELQDHFADICAESLPAGHGGTSRNTTSGSTGEPVQFLGTAVTSFFWHAFLLREHLWHRRDFGAKMLAIRVEKEASLYENWFGDLGTGIFQTGPCVVLPARWVFDRQLDRILHEQPQYLLGYASNLLGILRRAELRGARMPWLREVRSFGEAVPEEMRDYVRDFWKLPLSDVYTARETGYMAIQCREHGNYHVQSESAVVEIINEAGLPCMPGETGRVVITPLHNFATPLIRYDIGDYAQVGEPCPCGRGLPVLRRILGRRRNTLCMPDGSRRWPTLGPAKLLEIAPPIRRFKLVQKTLHDIEIRLMVGRPLTGIEIEGLRAHFTDQFGHPFNWILVFLDEFPPQRGDKFEDFVSEVA